VIFLLAWAALQFPSVQTKVVNRVTTELSKTLNTKVSIGAVDIKFFKTVALQNIYIEDQQQDTLLFAQSLEANIGVFSLFESQIFLNTIELNNAVVHLARPASDSLFNFNFLIDAFAPTEPKVEKDSTAKGWDFGIGNVLLSEVKFNLDDKFGGMDLKTRVGELSVGFDLMDLEKQRLEFNQLSLENSFVQLIQSSGGESQITDNQVVVDGEDVLEFPYFDWDIKIDNLNIEETNIILKQKNAIKKAGILNPNDLALKNIQLNIDNFLWEKERLKTEIKSIQIQEKSGFQLKDFGVAINMNPNEILLENLNLKTPNSQVKNTTQLRFNNFNDLVNDFNNIAFTTSFSQTKIGSNDLEHLVSTIGEIPFLNLTTNRFIKLDGKISGTLDKFTAQSLNAEVENALVLKLNGKVENVTNVEKLNLEITLEELSTSYEKATSILKDIELPEGLKSFGVFNLNGKINGQLADLKVEQLVLATDANTGFDISGNILGLPEVENLNLDLTIEKLFTIADDLNGFAENGLPEILDSLGKISYQGKFDGTLTKFDLAGKLNTALGILESDIFMNFNEDYSSADYKGDIRLNAFQLGKLLGDSLQIGEVTLQAELKGDGFAVDSLNAELKLNVEDLEYANYNYKDVLVDGLLQEGVFTGKLDLKDPNATVDFDGKVSLNSAQPVYQFTMLVDTLNLQKLNLVEDELSFHAKLDMNFSGKKLNDFDGEMNITEIFIKNKEEKFQTDSLQIESNNVSLNNRKLTVKSSFLSGEVEGDYDFDQMPDLILAYINDYFPLETMLTPEQQMVKFQDLEKPQNFELLFDVKDATPISVFVPQLEFMENARLTATFNSPEKIMDFKVAIQKIMFSGIRAETINLSSTGDADQLDNTLTINDIEVSNGVNIPQAIFRNKMLNDSMYLNLEVENDTIDKLINLAAVMNNSTEGYRLIFDKNMIANNKKWTIDEQNRIDFGTDFLKINELIFSYENQSLGIHSLDGKSSEAVKPIEISFENFQIKELSKIANIENTSFSGELNGGLRIIDPFENLHYTADLSIPNVVLNEESVGALSIDLDNPINTQDINVNVLLKGTENNMNISGDYNITSTQYNVNADIASLQLRLIDPIMIGVFGESKGTINGKFSLRGTPDKPNLNGEINMNKISTVIEFTKTRYAVNEGKVTFNNQEINLGSLQLIDRRNDKASLSGKITHDFFADLRLDLNMNTNRFTFLNTESSDNELFYGKLFLSATANIQGVVEQPVIEVKARTLEGSELNVSAFSEEDSFLEENFIIFGNPETYQKESEEKGTVVYEVENALPAEVRLNLELTDEAIFRVIVDPVTGDLLECRGNSDMLINLQPSGKVDIFGSYIIKSGKYRFSYTDVVKRNFEIVEGSSVAFNGDPLNARFNVTAKYTTKATPYELVSNETTLSESETNTAQKRQDVDVLMKMVGNIADPKLTFDIELPESEGTVLSSEIQRKLVELRNNQNELNKQVFGLLLFNGFIVSSGSADFADAGETVVLGSVSKFVSKQLNNLADKYIKGVQINFDVNSYKSQYANEGAGATVTELGIGVTKQFNDRLSLKAGGNFDLNSTSQSSGFSQVVGDFVLQYKLTKSGNYLLKAFRKSDFDVLNEENSVKTGVGISTSKSFGGKKKKE